MPFALSLLLVAFAVVLFILAIAPSATPSRYNLVAAGLACLAIERLLVVVWK
jgi:hypothetical protein